MDIYGIYIYIYWLVVWNMNFMTFHSVGNGKSSQLTLTHIFQRGGSTTNQYNNDMKIMRYNNDMD